MDTNEKTSYEQAKSDAGGCASGCGGIVVAALVIFIALVLVAQYLP